MDPLPNPPATPPAIAEVVPLPGAIPNTPPVNAPNPPAPVVIPRGKITKGDIILAVICIGLVIGVIYYAAKKPEAQLQQA